MGIKEGDLLNLDKEIKCPIYNKKGVWLIWM